MQGIRRWLHEEIGPPALSLTFVGRVLVRVVPSHWADALQSPPLSGRRWRFRDGRGSLAGCAAATSPAVPELRLVVSSLSFKTLTMPTSLRASNCNAVIMTVQAFRVHWINFRGADHIVYPKR